MNKSNDKVLRGEDTRDYIQGYKTLRFKTPAPLSPVPPTLEVIRK